MYLNKHLRKIVDLLKMHRNHTNDIRLLSKSYLKKDNTAFFSICLS